MSGASAPASYSTGGSPQTYIPTAQPQADALYQALINNQFAPAAGQVPGVNPANSAYQQAAGLYPAAYNAYTTDINNPYADTAISGAQGAQSIFNTQVYPPLSGTPQTLATGANQLAGTIPQLLNTGFDPQSALYNQLAGQSRDASNVANAGAGIGGTPYGASVAANAQNNFNLNWQAQQLARQTQATQAAGGALSSAGAGFNNALSLGTGLTQGYASANQLPYQASVGVGNNTISALNSLQNMLQGQANLGGQSFALPQQMINDLQSYLQLGQSAQQQGLAGGQAGFNQLAGGIGGGIAGANALFNPNTGLFGSGISSLLGGGGADASSLLIPGTNAALDAGGSAFTADLAAAAPAAAGS
jgi:hypothetical protein